MMVLPALLTAAVALSAADPASADSLAASRPDSAAARSLASFPPDSAGADSLAFRLRAVGVVVTAGEGRGQVLDPAGLAVDHFGHLYVTDAALHRMQRFDAAGGWLGESGALGSGEGRMRRPGAIAALGTLSIAVLDRENRRVLSYDLFGRLHGTLIDLEAPALQDQLGRVDPIDLAADRGGAVYVADADRDRVLAFDFSGRYLRTIGGLGARPGSFRGLSGIAVGRRGELVTAERGQARVQRLDPGGRALASWPIKVHSRRLALPVAVNDSAWIAVGDEAGGTVRVFDSTGRLLASLAGLEAPRALVFGRDGSLLVAEAAVPRVRRFVLEPRGVPRGE